MASKQVVNGNGRKGNVSNNIQGAVAEQVEQAASGQITGTEETVKEMKIRFQPQQSSGVVQCTCEYERAEIEVYVADHFSSQKAFGIVLQKVQSKWQNLDKKIIANLEATFINLWAEMCGGVTISQEIWAEADDMLKDPLLMDRLADDINKIGVVGEKELATIVYLVGTSRLLDKPLACIVQGDTASGKSYVISKVSEMFPPAEVIRAHGITSQSLVYTPPGVLQNRFIVAGERSRLKGDTAAEASRMRRDFLSDGTISRLVKGKLIERKGPVAYIESTTVEEIFEEDLNRCILVSPDLSNKQTRDIIDHYAKKAESPADCEERAHVVAKHWAMQLRLKKYGIVIPFASKLSQYISDKRIENRRMWSHILNTISASTLLFQKQRKVDTNVGDCIIATQQDYEVAYNCLARALVTANAGHEGATLKLYKRLQRSMGNREFTVSDVSNQDEIKDTKTIREHLNKLMAQGRVVEVKAAGGNQGARYRLEDAQEDEATLAGLPTPAKLFSDGNSTKKGGKHKAPKTMAA